jgi:precorrin-6x reductase
MINSKIDEIKTRMDANAIKITEEEGQYATRLEEQALQKQIDDLWTSYGEFEQAAEAQRAIIRAY